MVTDFDTFVANILTQQLARQRMAFPQKEGPPSPFTPPSAPQQPPGFWLEGPPIPAGYTPPEPAPATGLPNRGPATSLTPVPEEIRRQAQSQPNKVRTSDAYVLVLYPSAAGEQRIMVPVRKTQVMPDSARIVGEPITDPERLARAEQSGMLWEQQALPVQGQFRARTELPTITPSAPNPFPPMIQPNAAHPRGENMVLPAGAPPPTTGTSPWALGPGQEIRTDAGGQLPLAMNIANPAPLPWKVMHALRHTPLGSNLLNQKRTPQEQLDLGERLLYELLNPWQEAADDLSPF